MIKSYTITYRLSESDGQPFDKCRSIYSANIIADSAEQACSKLKSMFKMLKCDIVGQPGCLQITEDEYES